MSVVYSTLTSASPNSTTLLDNMNKCDGLPLCRFYYLTVPFGLLVAFSCLLTHAENSPVAGKLPQAPDNTFSIVVIPDTQQYRGRGTKGAAENE